MMFRATLALALAMCASTVAAVDPVKAGKITFDSRVSYDSNGKVHHLTTEWASRAVALENGSFEVDDEEEDDFEADESHRQLNHKEQYRCCETSNCGKKFCFGFAESAEDCFDAGFSFSRKRGKNQVCEESTYDIACCYET